MVDIYGDLFGDRPQSSLPCSRHSCCWTEATDTAAVVYRVDALSKIDRLPPSGHWLLVEIQ